MELGFKPRSSQHSDCSHELKRHLLLGRKATTNLVCACLCAQSLRMCPTLCNPMDCSPPGSSVHGILQARILEWIAISFSIVKVRCPEPPPLSKTLSQTTFYFRLGWD